MNIDDEIKPMNNAKKSRLGRGLGSLLGGNSSVDLGEEVEVVTAPDLVPEAIERQPSIDEKKYRESKIWKIDIQKLKANRQQPRKHFEKEKLMELADSVKCHGILNPIVARKLDDGGFEIIAGERRWRAAQMAGLEQVPVILKDVEDKISLELAIIENIQRHDLNPIEEAKAYKRLIEEYGLTQDEAAERVGKERSTVANCIRLLLLPPEVTEMVADGRLSAGHAKVLLGIADAKKQIELAKRIHEEKLSVRNTEKLLKEVLPQIISPPPAQTNAKDEVALRLIKQLKEDLQKTLGTKVDIDYNQAKGKMALYFYSDEQLNHLVDRLKRT